MHGSGWATVAIRCFPKAAQLFRLILSMNAQNREPQGAAVVLGSWSGTLWVVLSLVGRPGFEPGTKSL